MRLTELNKAGLKICIYHVLIWENYKDNNKKAVFELIDEVKTAKLSVYKQGIRTSFNRAFKGAIIAEFIISNRLNDVQRQTFFALIHNDWERLHYYITKQRLNYVS